MNMIQHICALGKGLLLGTALLGTSAKAASLNYGFCPQNSFCLWSGTNHTGAGFWGLEGKTVPYCQDVYIGFTGVGSYANYDVWPVHVEYWDRQVNEYSLAFIILHGHTSSNTTSNSLAGRAAYVRVLDASGCQ